MFWNLLTEGADQQQQGNPWSSYIIMGVLLIVIVVFMVMNRRNQKKRQEETVNMLNAIKPGNKVKTIGGICGVVVEVCDDNTFVLETGTEKSGKSYIKFDKQAVYQTDAVAEKSAAQAQAPVETPAQEEKAEVASEPVFEEEKPVENAQEKDAE